MQHCGAPLGRQRTAFMLLALVILTYNPESDEAEGVPPVARMHALYFDLFSLSRWLGKAYVLTPYAIDGASLPLGCWLNPQGSGCGI